MYKGFAEKLSVGREAMVTVTLAVAVPPRPAAVIVYVVVTGTVTFFVPLAATVPIP
jgi:hypothetical protein